MTAVQRSKFSANYQKYVKFLPDSCQNCGSKEDLVIHHIVPLIKGGANIATNMARLCSPCHALVHGQNANISALTKAGKEYAKKNNPDYKEGRPKRLLTPQYIHAVKLLETHTYKEVSAMTNLSKSTLQRIKKQYENESPL